MRKVVCVLAAMLLLATLGAKEGKEGKEAKSDDAAAKRAQIDDMAQQALDTLFAGNPDAKALYEKSYGWAVFDNLKVAFLVSGGAGSGVAVPKDGKRTYMKMGTGGVGLGLGGQKYQVIFLFENADVFNGFVEKGWKAETGAQAAAGTEGASVGAVFTKGMAIYQITEKGLMASADVSGTKYWKNEKLNK
jgi:lipid-binding SYLF domain-containing protein